MRNCMICGKESNLEISLCKSCYDIQLAINKKKYNWPFAMQSIRFDNLKKSDVIL